MRLKMTCNVLMSEDGIEFQGRTAPTLTPVTAAIVRPAI